MICITAVYPNEAEGRFDAGYYRDRHTAFARELLAPHGLLAIRSTIGVAALDGSPPPFRAISEMHFTSRTAFDAALAATGERLFADLANYTDINPILQVSELTGD